MNLLFGKLILQSNMLFKLDPEKVSRLKKKMFQRSRMDEVKLEHALGCFFKPSFLHISFCGSKEVMLESGTITIPEMYGSGCGGG